MAQASKAQQMVYFSERSGLPSYPVLGTLLCTNRRISFVPDANMAQVVCTLLLMVLLVISTNVLVNTSLAHYLLQGTVSMSNRQLQKQPCDWINQLAG